MPYSNKSLDVLGLDSNLSATISVARVRRPLRLGRPRMAELITQNTLEAVTIKRSTHVTMDSVLAYVRNLREFEFDGMRGIASAVAAIRVHLESGKAWRLARSATALYRSLR